MELTGNYIKTATSTIDGFELIHNISYNSQNEFTNLYSDLKKDSQYYGNIRYNVSEKRLIISIIDTVSINSEIRIKIYTEIENIISQLTSI